MVKAEKFDRELKQRGVNARVGMDATGHSRWFERLLAKLGIEVWIGDAAEIKTMRVRKQKTDRQDAKLLLKLLLEIAFRESGYRVRRIVICGNCFGTGIGWCSCGRGS
jgi:transposase